MASTNPPDQTVSTCIYRLESGLRNAASGYQSWCRQREKRRGIKERILKRQEMEKTRARDSGFIEEVMRKSGSIGSTHINGCRHLSSKFSENSRAAEIALDSIRSAANDIHEAAIDALAELYLRLRPSWTPYTLSDLPTLFCPLALSIQENPSIHIRPITPTERGAGEGVCPKCSGLIEYNPELATEDPVRAAFVGHLQPVKASEKAKTACPTCLKVFNQS
ncbi:MAG: hypothetical protein M1840_000343 [Geoglossum simile]|nr:MAG: hypothetical protein M1840_000343 [Geoglossum simile]